MQTIARTLIGVLAAVLAVGLVIFGVQNTRLVQIQFMGFATEQLSLSLVVIAAAITGGALVWLVGLWGAAQRSLRHMREAKERTTLATRNKELEAKVTSLERELATYRPPSTEAKAGGKTAAKQ